MRKAVLMLAAAAALRAQITTGIVEGSVRDRDGRPLSGVAISAVGGAGLHASARSDAEGRFKLILPYGRYRINNTEIFVRPLRITRVTLTAVPQPAVRYPMPFSVQGILLNREAAAVTAPLDFTGLRDNRLALISDRAMSWTATEFKLNGMNTTDPYQPGRPLLLADPDAIAGMEMRARFSQITSDAFASEAGVFLEEARRCWHGSISTAESGSALAWSNLPPPASRGIVQQAEYFRWFTHDAAQIGGPVSGRADLFAAIAGQWSSQTEALAAGDQDTRALYGNLGGRVRLDEKDRLDAVYSGSRLSLSNFAMPAGIEALGGWADSPSFVLPGGFDGQSESDRFDALQLGWTHEDGGLTEVRYQYAAARLGTAPENADARSVVELLDGAAAGAPPLNNRASRTREAIEGAWQPRSLFGSARNNFVAGAGWMTASARNRFTAPSNMTWITAGAAPAFIVDLNTPAESAGTIRSFTAYAADHARVTKNFSIDAGALADFSRGSPISWISISPRAAFAWRPARRVVFRGAYFRVYSPIAARYLDFDNPNSLSGTVYQWLGGSSAGTGPMLARFGGAYSSISPSLKRPYADEFDIAAQLGVTRTISFVAHLYRRDDKRRIALTDPGVPFSAYTPTPFFDSLGGQTITVYAQNPATFGQDRYLLTNPPDLRFETSGIVSALRVRLRSFFVEASFTAENAWGPTNPGDSAIENDPGVIGALGLNPNTLINAGGRNYFDRGFVGKLRGAYRLPWGVQLTAAAVYLDGLPFARRLLVTGLPQGPVVVAATIRGNPGNGNRAEYVFNWNLRAAREFRSRFGVFTGAIDAMNVTNSGQKIQESDVSSPQFSERLPVAIQEPRSLRLLFRYEF
ncbi:MAG TPA: carboxypeptidase-like regulatory domain-containing protein [Bryobacteraceae bacterium]|jgi:hypothetical protein|nr:carboxypeptidase-like regulatory domain-containing protein [Bryobacteraceae bacterium]